jgi:hypothetical protein
MTLSNGQGSVLVFVEAEVLRLLAESAIIRNNHDVGRLIPAHPIAVPKEWRIWSVRMVWGELLRRELELGKTRGWRWRWKWK